MALKSVNRRRRGCTSLYVRRFENGETTHKARAEVVGVFEGSATSEGMNFDWVPLQYSERFANLKRK